MFLIAYAKIIGFAVYKKKNFSLCSISNHAVTFSGYHNASLLPSPQVSLTVAPFQGTPRRLSVTMPPFPLSPQFSLSDAPSWELQGGDQSPLLPIGVGPDWGLALGPYLILWPFLVSWSVPQVSPVWARPSRESELRSERKPGILSGGPPPCLPQGSFAPAWLSHQSGRLLSRPA